MTETSWRDRIDRGRDLLQGRTADLSASAQAAAEGAGVRIGKVYGQVRDQVGQSTSATKARAANLAETGAARASHLGAEARELGGEALRRGRETLDRATLASRGLVAERPLTAVVLGIGAGIVLGVLANRLGRNRQAESTDEDSAETDEWYQ
jgi:ElaB/YqjD/DUF883 family membrane-anchored ribosome-binding protein